MLIPFDHLFQKYKIEAQGVLHIGANRGEEAEAYYQQGIRRAIWIEAHCPTYLKLVDHLKRFPNYDAYNVCIGDEDGKEVTFHVANNGSQSSSILDLGTHAIAHPTVKYVEEIPMTMTRIDTLLGQRWEREAFGDRWFLNIDLQGAELLALRGMGVLLHHFHYAYIEVNEQELYKGCPLAPEIDCYLSVYGLFPIETKMTGSGWGDRYYQRL